MVGFPEMGQGFSSGLKRKNNVEVGRNMYSVGFFTNVDGDWRVQFVGHGGGKTYRLEGDQFVKMRGR